MTFDQFKNHVEEFNSFNFGTKIDLKNLRDYERASLVNTHRLPNEITVFYYCSDLISDEQKEKIINFKTTTTMANGISFLDEAYKGDKEDSKRQILYSTFKKWIFV